MTRCLEEMSLCHRLTWECTSCFLHEWLRGKHGFRFEFQADAFSKMNKVTLPFQEKQAIAFSSQKSQGKSHASTVINTEILEKESVHEFTEPSEFFVTVKPRWQRKQQPFPFSSCRAEAWCGSGGQALGQRQLVGFKPHMAVLPMLVPSNRAWHWISSPPKAGCHLRGSCG